MISLLRRLHTVGTAVVLGVGFLAAVLAFNDSLWKTVEQDLEKAFSEYNHVVEQPRPLFDAGTLDAELAEQIRAVPGVDQVTPSIRTHTIVERGTLQDLVQLRSMDWLPPGTEVVEGEWPEAGEVVLDVSVARDLGFSPGDTVRVLDDMEDTEYTEVVVSGTVEGTPSSPVSEGGHFVYGEVDSLVQVLDHPDSEYSLLFVQGSADTESGELAAALDALTTEDLDYSVIPTDTFISSETHNALPGGKTLATGITAVSAAAFTVLLLVIRSVFTVRIERDRHEFSLRRCLGASRGHIFGSVLLEALAIGTVSSLVGVALGAGLLAALFTLPPVPFDFGVDAASVAIAVAAGVATCIVGALGPAMQAMKNSPLEALRDSADTVQNGTVERRPWLRSAVLLLALFGLGTSAHLGVLPGAIFMAAVLVVAVLSLIRPVTVAITRLLLRIPWVNRCVVPSEALERTLANPHRSGSIVALAMVTTAFVSLWPAGAPWYSPRWRWSSPTLSGPIWKSRWTTNKSQRPTFWKRFRAWTRSRTPSWSTPSGRTSLPTMPTVTPKVRCWCEPSPNWNASPMHPNTSTMWHPGQLSSVKCSDSSRTNRSRSPTATDPSRFEVWSGRRPPTACTWHRTISTPSLQRAAHTRSGSPSSRRPTSERPRPKWPMRSPERRSPTKATAGRWPSSRNTSLCSPLWCFSCSAWAWSLPWSVPPTHSESRSWKDARRSVCNVPLAYTGRPCAGSW